MVSKMLVRLLFFSLLVNLLPSFTLISPEEFSTQNTLSYPTTRSGIATFSDDLNNVPSQLQPLSNQYCLVTDDSESASVNLNSNIVLSLKYKTLFFITFQEYYN